ncbi:MAG: TnpV protein [Monoglobaceae bacterium]
MARREGVTEQLKADKQLEWVQRMNNIRSSAIKIAITDLIYT